jgi:hypothetical protein
MQIIVGQDHPNNRFNQQYIRVFRGRGRWNEVVDADLAGGTLKLGSDLAMAQVAGSPLAGVSGFSQTLGGG